jgi:hypothetical protein
LLGGLDLLLRGEHAMTDHLTEVPSEGRISGALALELLESLLALDASLLELLLAGLGSPGGLRLGFRWLLNLGLSLRLRWLGYLGPHCLSCHFASRLPVAPRDVWHPDYWLNTRNRPTLPPSVNHSFKPD